MRPAHHFPRVLALPAALGLAVALLVTAGDTGPVPTRPTSWPQSTIATAANAALDAASQRAVTAAGTLRRARGALPVAVNAFARSSAALARANDALLRARAVNRSYVRVSDAASLAVDRARAVFDSASHNVITYATRLRSAAGAKQAADRAVAQALAVADAAKRLVEKLLAEQSTSSAAPEPSTSTEPSSAEPSSAEPSSAEPSSAEPSSAEPSSTGASESTSAGLAAASASLSPIPGPDHLAAAEAALALALQAVARATGVQTHARTAYLTALSRASHARTAQSHAAVALHAAGLRQDRVSAMEPRGLATARIRASNAASAYRGAASVLRIRRLKLHNATLEERAAAAAFRKARAAALNANLPIARSPVCSPGNVYAGAATSRVLSVPGLTITRYRKADHTAMWVTAANLAGAGPQVRPGPLTPPVVSTRTQQSVQLAGSHALAAVNGDFYYIGADNSTVGPEIRLGGDIVKGVSLPSRESVIVGRNGVASIGYLAITITLRHGKAAVGANSLNSRELPRDGIAVFTSRWGHASREYLHPSQPAREYVVKSTGVVSIVKAGVSDSPIPAGGMVIVAQGSALRRLAVAGIGRSAKVTLAKRIRTQVPSGVSSGIGIGMVLIQHGIDRPVGCNDDREVARTLVGIKPGGQELFVVTIQGQTDSAKTNFTGLSTRQALGLMRSLGAYDAATFDGGGSTILTARFGNTYKMVSASPGWIRPVANSFAFWPR